MNRAAHSSGPLPELSRVARDDEADLDARIFAAEQAVIARDVRVRHRLGVLGERAQHVLGTRLRWSLFGLGASALVAVMRPARTPVAPRAPAAWWTHLLPLVWPWMPLSVRRRVSPATVALVVDLALPLFRRRRARSTSARR